jgi:PIN domain nuclease of toxin-antitoxin system
MDYVADTVALVRHLRHKRLGRQATQVFREADAGQHTIAISSITLMEILYLSEAKRIDVRLPEVINLTLASTNYAIVPIDADIVLTAATIDDVPELHDRILVATASSLGIPLLTSDYVIAGSKHVQVIW